MDQTTRWDTKQRLCNYGAQFGDDGGYLGAAFFAGIAQVWDDPPEFEQGIAGYARRFGTRYAQTAAKNTGELLQVFYRTFRNMLLASSLINLKQQAQKFQR
jgi:hypothetical protein